MWQKFVYPWRHMNNNSWSKFIYICYTRTEHENTLQEQFCFEKTEVTTLFFSCSSSQAFNFLYNFIRKLCSNKLTNLMFDHVLISSFINFKAFKTYLSSSNFVNRWLSLALNLRMSVYCLSAPNFRRICLCHYILLLIC